MLEIKLNIQCAHLYLPTVCLFKIYSICICTVDSFIYVVTTQLNLTDNRMLPISVEQRKRQRSSSSILVNEQDDLDTEVEITPPPSPQPESNGDAGELKCAIWYFHTQ